MERSIRILLVFFIIALVFGTIVSNNTRKDIVGQWPDDGNYYMKSNSYHGYFVNEQAHIQLALVQIHKNSKKSKPLEYRSFYLISEQGEIEARTGNFILGEGQKEYSLYTLELFLPNLSQGYYEINKLKLVDNKNNETVYDIGDWTLEIKKGEESKDIRTGKTLLMTSGFDSYSTELINLTNKQIMIGDLFFKLKDKEYLIKAEKGKDFDMQEERSVDMNLEPGDKRGFRYSFSAKDNSDINVCEFISIKPFIKYYIDNKEYETSLPAAIYSPCVTEETIQYLINEL